MMPKFEATVWIITLHYAADTEQRHCSGCLCGLALLPSGSRRAENIIALAWKTLSTPREHWLGAEKPVFKCPEVPKIGKDALGPDLKLKCLWQLGGWQKRGWWIIYLNECIYKCLCMYMEV